MAVCSACGSTIGAAQRLSSCDLVAMADTAEREDRIEILERENERLREHRCQVSVPVVDLLKALRKEFDK